MRRALLRLARWLARIGMPSLRGRDQYVGPPPLDETSLRAMDLLSAAQIERLRAFERANRRTPRTEVQP